MASTHKHIRSGTANKRPTTAIADGQIALNTNLSSPGLFFKDSTGAEILKIGPVHVGATAPNASPAGSAGNSTGEIWLDTSLTPVGVKIWNGSAFVNATPIGSTTVQGLLELATDAETQAGADTARAVTSASLQSKLSDSTSTTSNTTIASSTAVKAAYDLANAALPKTGGTVTGNLEIGTAGSLSFEGATADGFETTIAITDPTADRTITLPNTTGTVVTTGDTGTVTSTMLLDGTIVDADINASAAIAYSKLASLTSANILVGNSSNVATSTAVTGDVTISNAGVTAISAGAIVNADVNASAAIAGTKISPDFGAQTIVTTGVHSAALGAAATPSITFTGDLNTGIYSPGADQVAVATNGTQRLSIGSTGNIDIDSNTVFIDAVNNRVGVGTNSPSGPLHVEATTDGPQTLAYLVNGSTGGTNETAALAFALKGTAGTGLCRISAGKDNDFSTEANIDSHLTFSTTLNDAEGERLRITSAGLVGIGTSGPTAPLHLVTASSDPMLIKTTGTSAYNSLVFENDIGSKVAIGIGGSTVGGSPQDSGYVGTISNKPFYINTNNTSRVAVTAAGLVGIGVTSPSSPLTVQLPGSAGEVARFLNGANEARFHFITDTTSQIQSQNSNLYLNAYDNYPLLLGTNNTERARIDTSGRLLVGTIASPAHQLQVSTDSAGKPSTNTWTIVSDERIKEEIELADLDLCYEAVKTIPLKRFKWKDEVYTEKQVKDRRKLGWIAQDVEAVFPKAVGTYEFKYNQVFEETIIPAVEEVLDDEGNVTTPAQPERIEKGELISEDVIEDCRDLNSDQLYAAMYGAIQKLMIKVETLETELAALKAS